MTRGEGIYKELCFTCHGNDGRGTQKVGAPAGTTMAPSLASSPRMTGHRDHVIKMLLHGMTGPLDGERYEEVMVPMGSNQDQWIADVASFVRNSFGNSSALVTPADVARVRAATANRKTPWTVEELTASLPTMLPAETSWKVTASHNTETARRALTFAPWSSGVPQAAGMWLQVELPQAVSLTEIQFTSGGGGRGGGGGGGGGRAGGGPWWPQARPQLERPVNLARRCNLLSFRRRLRQLRRESKRATACRRRDRRPRAGSRAATRCKSRSTACPGRPSLPARAPPARRRSRSRQFRQRFVRMTQTATADGAPPWAMQNLKLYQSGSTAR